MFRVMTTKEKMNNTHMRQVSGKNYYAWWAEAQAVETDTAGYGSILRMIDNTWSAYSSIGKEAKEQLEPEIIFDREPKWLQMLCSGAKQTSSCEINIEEMAHL